MSLGCLCLRAHAEANVELAVLPLLSEELKIRETFMGAGTGKLDMKLRAVVMRGIICEWLSAGTSRCSPRGFGIVFCLPRLTFVLCDSVVEFAVAVTERTAIYFLTPCCTPGVVLLAVIIPFYERAKVVLLD